MNSEIYFCFSYNMLLYYLVRYIFPLIILNIEDFSLLLQDSRNAKFFSPVQLKIHRA